MKIIEKTDIKYSWLYLYSIQQ